MLKKLLYLTALIFIVFFYLLATKDQIYQIQSGASITQIAQDLEKKGIIKSVNLMLIIAHYMAIIPKTGYYQTGDNLYKLLQKFNSAKVKIGKITFIPGKNVKDYYQLLQQKKYIKTIKSFEEIMQDLKIKKPYEGKFLAQTYYYNYGDTASNIFQHSYNLMQQKIDNIWNNRIQNKFIKTKYQLIILASLLEKESANNAEKAKIAGVFINRLSKNMRLQTDPTVIYALSDKYNGKLTSANLKIKHPYNTYQNKGLPPGAIANVGVDSLLAASRPINHNFLYFVAKNSKQHIFAKTYKEHLNNSKNF